MAASEALARRSTGVMREETGEPTGEFTNRTEAIGARKCPPNRTLSRKGEAAAIGEPARLGRARSQPSGVG
jgi:hypothetical protein